MHSNLFLAGAALLGATSAIPTDFSSSFSRQDANSIAKRQVPVLPCSDTTGGVHVIATGGTGTANPKEYGRLGTLSTSILNAIPGSSNVSVPYDKLTTRTNPNAIPDGVNTFTDYVNQYHEACPNTKIVVIGYSSGAIISMNALCEGRIDQGLADSTIVATVVYGDQTRTAGQPYNLGTCTDGSGKSPRDPAGCGAFANSLQSYCDYGDPECCVPGTDPNIHFVYPGEYDGAATQFVVDQFNGA